MTHKEPDAVEVLKNLSRQDFLNIGIDQVAYIRRVMLEDKAVFMVHAADGTPLSVLDSPETAEFMVRHNDLEPITLH